MFFVPMLVNIAIKTSILEISPSVIFSVPPGIFRKNYATAASNIVRPEKGKKGVSIVCCTMNRCHSLVRSALGKLKGGASSGRRMFFVTRAHCTVLNIQRPWSTWNILAALLKCVGISHLVLCRNKRVEEYKNKHILGS